jgi:hypothetical protein
LIFLSAFFVLYTYLIVNFSAFLGWGKNSNNSISTIPPYTKISYHDHDFRVLDKLVIMGVADFHEERLGHKGFGDLALDAKVHKIDGPGTELGFLSRVHPHSI